MQPSHCLGTTQEIHFDPPPPDNTLTSRQKTQHFLEQVLHCFTSAQYSHTVLLQISQHSTLSLTQYFLNCSNPKSYTFRTRCMYAIGTMHRTLLPGNLCNTNHTSCLAVGDKVVPLITAAITHSLIAHATKSDIHCIFEAVLAVAFGASRTSK